MDKVMATKKRGVKRLLTRKTLKPKERALLVVADAVEMVNKNKPLLSDAQRDEFISSWRAKTLDERSEYNKYIKGWDTTRSALLYVDTRHKSAIVAELTGALAVKSLISSFNISYIKGFGKLAKLTKEIEPSLVSLSAQEIGGEIDKLSWVSRTLTDIYEEVLAYNKLAEYLGEIYESKIGDITKRYLAEIKNLIGDFNDKLNFISTLKGRLSDIGDGFETSEYGDLLSKSLIGFSIPDYAIELDKLSPKFKDNQTLDSFIDQLQKTLGGEFDIKQLLG